MGEGTRRMKVTRVSGAGRESVNDLISAEIPVTVFLNDDELATMMCSPKDLEALAVGFLFAEGLVKDRMDIKRVFADAKQGGVWVETRSARRPQENIAGRRYITSGCGRGVTFVDATKASKLLKSRSKLRVPSNSISALMAEFLRMSRIYRLTGGVHGAALASAKKILVFKEDIGRHNAVDKVIGASILKRIPTKDKIMLSSGRITSEILVKAARAQIPIVISKAAPTDLAVQLADDFGLTLVGFARGSRMNVYTNPQRIAVRGRARKSSRDS